MVLRTTRRASRRKGKDMGSARTMIAAGALAGIALAEGAAGVLRGRRHCEQFRAALERALVLKRPVVVFGDCGPCVGSRRSLGYRFSVVYPVVFRNVKGVVPLCESEAPCDLAEFSDDSVVVLIKGVLEYAPDPDAIVGELRRVAGAHVFFGAQLQRWTLTAAALARRTGPGAELRPVPTIQRVAAATLVAAVAVGLLPATSRNTP